MTVLTNPSGGPAQISCLNRHSLQCGLGLEFDVRTGVVCAKASKTILHSASSNVFFTWFEQIASEASSSSLKLSGTTEGGKCYPLILRSIPFNDQEVAALPDTGSVKYLGASLVASADDIEIASEVGFGQSLKTLFHVADEYLSAGFVNVGETTNKCMHKTLVAVID